MKVLPDTLQYLALVLYSYEDLERNFLNPFKWQLCQSTEIKDVQGWLKSNTFPELNSSDLILEQLGRGAIGTDDDDTINKLICPAMNPVLTISVTWPDDRPGGPSSEVQIYTKQVKKIHNKIRIIQ